MPWVTSCPQIDPDAFVHPDSDDHRQRRDRAGRRRCGRRPCCGATRAASWSAPARRCRTARCCTAPGSSRRSSAPTARSATSRTSRAARWRTARWSAPARSCCTGRSCAPARSSARARSCRTAWRCRAARWRSASRRSCALDAVKPDQITHPAQEYQRNWARYRAEMRRIDGLVATGRRGAATRDSVHGADDAADAAGDRHREHRQPDDDANRGAAVQRAPPSCAPSAPRPTSAPSATAAVTTMRTVVIGAA